MEHDKPSIGNVPKDLRHSSTSACTISLSSSVNEPTVTNEVPFSGYIILFIIISAFNLWMSATVATWVDVTVASLCFVPLLFWDLNRPYYSVR